MVVLVESAKTVKELHEEADQAACPKTSQNVHIHKFQLTLSEFNITMENHHVLLENPLFLFYGHVQWLCNKITGG